MPELRQLRYFLAVAEELHFGRAAARLNMTQPPLSQAIAALEANLGCALFLRNTRHIAMTPAGIALIPAVKNLLMQAQALPQLALDATTGKTGKLRLAFVSIADYSILPPALREFRQGYPAVDIELREATSDIQLAALSEGEIDAGILLAPLPHKYQAELNFTPLLREQLMLAAPAHLDFDAPVSAHACAALPLILFPRKIAPALHDVILGYFHNAGITPEIAQQAIQMQTIVSLVAAGMGIALVPQSVSQLQRTGVRYHALQHSSSSVELGFATRKDHASPVLHAFFEILRHVDTPKP